MRKLPAGFCLCVVLCSALCAPAQTPYEEQQFRPTPANTAIRPGGMTLSEQLIFERAVQRDRQRSARLETRRWLGVSAQRPQITIGQHSASLNAAMYPAWEWQASPVWMRANWR